MHFGKYNDLWMNLMQYMRDLKGYGVSQKMDKLDERLMQ